MASLLERALQSRVGQWSLEAVVAVTRYRVFSPRTVHAMRFDLLRLAARRRLPATAAPPSDRLHFGCGDRKASGWLNVDVAGSDLDLDFAAGRLPWPDQSFSVVVSQHVIEHLHLFDELIPVLKELHRVLRPGGEIWLTCPDMEKVCRGYVADRAQSLLQDKRSRTTADIGMGAAPSQHFVNLLFDQDGEHKNLFDFELLAWALTRSGFDRSEPVSERQLMDRFPGFPLRGDEHQSLYVRATRR